MATPNPEDNDSDSDMSWTSLGDDNFVPGTDLDDKSSSSDQDFSRSSSDSQSAAFEKEFIPREQVSIDECMIPFKGRLRNKMYMKMKPVKWGIKVDMLVDWETGYCFRFLVYGGRIDVSQPLQHLGKLGCTITRLMDGMQHKGYTLTVDRGYNTAPSGK
ncbi:PiggyBac transposable element-derived protein 4 [Elysia marginata]|uniref:PiggyBac transposable element-derived protein 4 n=1 Tax=Elysia marginata TaxID=1093978 RepID=A0AAV4F8C0_9GAST|nr:PiggyBac transposable element-derived protein 4 [Elysia marginata]